MSRGEEERKKQAIRSNEERKREERYSNILHRPHYAYL